MNQLIPVFSGSINNDQVQLVDARILHKTLNVISRFNDWISNRIKEYSFIENQDYISFTKNLVKPNVGRPAINYHLTLDMAKELAMIERTEIGRQVRRYFIQCERKLLSFNNKTTTDQRTPLRDAVNMLVGKKGLMYPEAYSVIHQRFNVKHIDELSADQVPIAIEYVHKLTLEVEWLPDQKKKLVEKQPEKVLHNLECLIAQMYFLRGWWDKFGPAISGLNPRVASSISGLFHDGWFIASGVAQELKLPTPDKEYIKHYPWDADCREQNEYYLANKK